MEKRQLRERSADFRPLQLTHDQQSPNIKQLSTLKRHKCRAPARQSLHRRSASSFQLHRADEDPVRAKLLDEALYNRQNFPLACRIAPTAFAWHDKDLFGISSSGRQRGEIEQVYVC